MKTLTPLSRLSSSEDPIFDGGEEEDDYDMVCSIKTLSLQIQSTDSTLVKKESSKNPVLAKVMQFTREGWPYSLSSDDPAQQFQRISASLSNCHPRMSSIWHKTGHSFDI